MVPVYGIKKDSHKMAVLLSFMDQMPGSGGRED